MIRSLAVLTLIALPFSRVNVSSEMGAIGMRPDSLTIQLDRIFRAVDSATTPGCVIGVHRKNGSRLIRSYGLADLELGVRNDSLTVFEAGSVSKQVTAAAVLLLAHDGRLSLDDDLRRWFPELSPALPRMTVRELLTHESGLRDWGDLVELAGWPRGTKEFRMPEAVQLIVRQHALNFAPGTEYSYSNSNYVLAAELVARASGMSFASYTSRKIFVPLGMSHSSWRTDFRSVVPGRATAWSPGDSSGWMLDMPFEDVVGLAGLLTTVPDLLRWQASFSSSALGGATFASEMEQPGTLRNGRRTRYALGLELDSLDGERTVSHAGSTGGYRAYVGRVPASGVDVALLCNAGSLNTEDLGPVVLAAAAGLRAPSDARRPELGDSATMTSNAALARLDGSYRSRRTRQTVRVRGFARGISINSWTGYVAHGDRFTSLDGRRFVDFRFASGDVVLGYRLTTIDGDTVVFDRVAAWHPQATHLRQFAGAFHSDDADAQWHVEVARDSLVVRVREGVTHALVPLYLDTFTVPDEGWLVSFRRDGTGRVAGLTVGMTRARSVPFVRR